jgi:hypothetical protein
MHRRRLAIGADRASPARGEAQSCQYAHSSPGQAFEPEVIQEMSLALESVCENLELSLTDDPATRLAASKIIELARRRVRDAPTLSAMTLKEFKHH